MVIGAVASIFVLLASGPSTVSAEPDPPPAFYVSMDSNAAYVNATLDQNYTPATLTGSVITNYPGYKYDIYIEAACGSSPTTSSPDHIEIRGKDTVNFTIGIALVKGDGPNTTCTGQFSITALMSNPGRDDLYLYQGNIMAQATWPLPNRSAASGTGQASWDDYKSTGPSTAAEDLEAGVLVATGVLIVGVLAAIGLRKLRSRRRKGLHGN